MVNNIGGRIWWWVLLAVIVLGGLGYYWYSRTGPEQEEVLVIEDLSPVDKKAPSKGEPGTKTPGLERPGVEDVTEKYPGGKPIPIDKKAIQEKDLGVGALPAEKEELLQKLRAATEDKLERLFELGKDDAFRTDGEAKRLFEPRKGDLFGKAPADKIYCDLIDEYVADFFAYLNTKKYIERLDLKVNTYAYFKKIIRTLAARPPAPAGEGFAPTVMVKNIFFFSRALDRKSLRLFKEVVVNERDTLEINLEMFYRWFMLGKLCPNPEQVRLPFDVMYRYAGFFLNTTGGRAYLFRRSVTLRLLLTYYSVLVVYQADRLGKNSYGINLSPFIQPLRKEIGHYPDFEFQNQYVRTLTRIEDYYLQKR
ncbi:MAG: hypothetical protein JRI73_12490 [Deltaproteobacteria bacterium]|nr:hypothetical protein [Deltaproteobacteria bacterium]